MEIVRGPVVRGFHAQIFADVIQISVVIRVALLRVAKLRGLFFFSFSLSGDVIDTVSSATGGFDDQHVARLDLNREFAAEVFHFIAAGSAQQVAA